MPPYRTQMYSEWRACERFGMIPNGVNPIWGENHPWVITLLLAYNEIRDREEVEMLGAKI